MPLADAHSDAIIAASAACSGIHSNKEHQARSCLPGVHMKAQQGYQRWRAGWGVLHVKLLDGDRVAKLVAQ